MFSVGSDQKKAFKYSILISICKMEACKHTNITCLNQYDLIRKYRCFNCGAVMMCSCDKAFGEKFLPHQLDQGSVLETREHVPVTHGFLDNVCQECRGEELTPAPKSSHRGASKIRRYYWREIYFETTRRFFEKHPEIDPNDSSGYEAALYEERKEIEKEVLEEIKKLHAKNPKYKYNEVPQSEILKKCEAETILVNAVHKKGEDRKVKIIDGTEEKTVEEFAIDYFKDRGYEALETESIPFHVLFGIYMWALIQDFADPQNRMVGFGRKTDNDEGGQSSVINTFLPTDFGTKGYYERRKDDIDKHLSQISDIEWLFDYWLDHSHDFRQYLWAYRDEDIKKAKKIIDIIGEENLRKILRYMVKDYWRNFCGWPDLLVYNESEFFFSEVKSSGDSLSEDQKNWIVGNYENMKFEFKLFKVGKNKN